MTNYRILYVSYWLSVKYPGEGLGRRRGNACATTNNSKCSPRGSMFWNEFTVLYINTIHIVPPDWSTHLSSSRVHVQGKSCVHTVVRLMYFMRKVREWRVSGAIRSIRAQRNTVTSLNWPPWLHDVRPRPFCLTLLHPLIKHASQVLARRQRLRPELRLASRGLVRVRAICGAGGLHACELASPGHGGWSLASAHTPYSSWHQ